MTGGVAAVSGRPRIKSTVRHTQAVCRWTQCHSRNFGFLTHKMGMPPRGAVEIKGGNAGKSLSPVVGTEQGLKRWWLLLLCHCPHNCSQTPTSEDCALGRATRMQECFPVSFSAVRIRAAQRIKWGPVMGQANYCIGDGAWPTGAPCTSIPRSGGPGWELPPELQSKPQGISPFTVRWQCSNCPARAQGSLGTSPNSETPPHSPLQPQALRFVVIFLPNEYIIASQDRPG